MSIDVAVRREVLGGLLGLARTLHPQEVVLLLRGKAERGRVLVEEYVFPPYARAGRNYAGFPSHMLPIDFSVVGTAHSHPSGSLRPSRADLDNFYGRIMVIVAYPYTGDSLAAYDGRGEFLQVAVIG